MVTTLVTGIGTLVSGSPTTPPIHDTTLLAHDGVIAGIGVTDVDADRVVDAGGLTAIPGLVDGHVHPVMGDWTPAQNATGWIRNYLHGGTTSMVSAGELHAPGLRLDELTPEVVLALAITMRATTGRLRSPAVRMHCGTVLLVPGLTEADFDRIAAAGLRHLKYLFYDWGRGFDEARAYAAWARDRDLVVKLHSGGVSRSGVSRPAGVEVVAAVHPDVVAHVSGGPIPMPDEEIREIVDTLPDTAIEICSSGNDRATIETVRHLADRGALHRLTLGTDTPGGTGIIPRGMLRNVCFLASVCGLEPEAAVAAATGNVARHHRIDGGLLAVGQPADLVLLDPVTGSRAVDGLDCFRRGDLPGISVVLVGGEPVVLGSEQTPPPRRQATVAVAPWGLR